MAKKNQNKTPQTKQTVNNSNPEELDTQNASVKDDTIDTTALQEELAQAQSSVKENWEQVLRLKAELDNQKKRHIKVLEDAHKYALNDFVKALVGVKDSLDMGLQSAQSDTVSIKSMQEGLEMIDKSFMGVLENFGVVLVNPIGEKFDPNLHEAITMLPIEGKENQEVVEVVQVGITLNGRLIRPARVIVAQQLLSTA